eukprot:scaffold21298_cov127-Cylindrotheca_fusiformis.AAC.1
MVPPKELKHDIIQLEGPLQSCIQCLQELGKLLFPNGNNSSSSLNSKEDSGATAASSDAKRSVSQSVL